jgi:hypothetical protein
MLLHAGGVTFCVIAWGYLVSAAIDFGSSARSGRTEAWTYLGVACVGAACCLFAGLMMAARLLRSLGITSGPPSAETDTRDLVPPTYTSHSSHSAHGSHSSHSHGSHAAHGANGTKASADPKVPAPRHGGGHRGARH